MYDSVCKMRNRRFNFCLTSSFDKALFFQALLCYLIFPFVLFLTNKIKYIKKNSISYIKTSKFSNIKCIDKCQTKKKERKEMKRKKILQFCVFRNTSACFRIKY